MFAQQNKINTKEGREHHALLTRDIQVENVSSLSTSFVKLSLATARSVSKYHAQLDWTGIPEDGSPLRTSRSAFCAVGGREGDQGRRSVDAVTVSLSPPRSRYRFDRLPPEEQSYLDRRMKERRELEVGGTLSTSAGTIYFGRHYCTTPCGMEYIDVCL